MIAQARTADLLSDEHFTVDGTLLEAWASLKSFRRKDDGPTPPPDDPGNPTVNFHGESRRNDTHHVHHRPRRDAGAEGAGREAKLSYAGHVLLDNRHGLVANVCVTAATGTAEREAAVLLLAEAAGRDDRRRRQEFRRRQFRRGACARWGSRRTSRRR